MSKAFPADRTLVDTQRKIIDPWLGPLKRLEPLLKLEPADITTLLALIEAAQNASEEDPFSLSAAIAALAVDSAPDFSADYAVGYDTSGSAGKRYPLSIIGRSALLESIPLSSNSSVGLALPTTYPHSRIALHSFSFSTTAEARWSLSEDSGATFLDAAFEIFNSASIHAATTADTTPNLTPSGGSGATAVFSAIIDIHDVLGSNNKIARMSSVLDSSGSAYEGIYVFTSVAPVNYAQVITSTGTFDAGTLELWGMP